MKKLLTLLLLSVFLINIASADLGTFTQGSCVNIKTLSNESAVNLSTINIGSQTTVINTPMQNVAGMTFNYSYCNTTTLGIYVYDWYPCNSNLDCVNSFTISPSGDHLDSSKSMLYGILLLFIFLIDGLCLYVIFGLNLDNYRGGDDEMIGISLKKYLKIFLIGLMYGLVLLTLNLMNVVANNLTLTQFANIIGGLFQILLRMVIVWTLMICIWILVAAWKDNQLIKEIRKRVDSGEWGISGDNE